jgi:amino acid transporter
MANKKSDSGFAESPTARTSKRIAYFLIVVYGFLLTGVFFVSWTIDGDTNFWTELFKAGFLLLGGALTTIIGYFFGSRAIQEAEDSAKKPFKKRPLPVLRLIAFNLKSIGLRTN